MNVIDAGKTIVKVYDLKQSLIFQNNFTNTNGLNTFSINTDDFKNGIYFVSVNTGESVKVFKCVKVSLH